MAAAYADFYLSWTATQLAALLLSLSTSLAIVGFVVFFFSCDAMRYPYKSHKNNY